MKIKEIGKQERQFQIEIGENDLRELKAFIGCVQPLRVAEATAGNFSMERFNKLANKIYTPMEEILDAGS